jgi:hypothetical protein
LVVDAINALAHPFLPSGLRACPWAFFRSNFLQLDTDHRESGEIEGVAKRLVILMLHTAVCVVDTDCPSLFAGLL